MLLNLRKLTNLIVQIGSLPRRVPRLTCFQEQVGWGPRLEFIPHGPKAATLALISEPPNPKTTPEK